MADPFSIVAVTETGLKVAQLLTNIIKDLRDAPDELLALSNEMWNLKLLLDDVQELERSSDERSAGKLDAVKALVYQTRIKLDKLSTMTTQWGRLSPWGDSFNMGRRDRFLWLKEKRRVTKLQNELRELRFNLSTAIGTKTSTTAARIEVNIQRLVSQLYEMSAENVKRSAAAPENALYPADMINEVHRNQQESRKVLQNMTQALSRLTLKDTLDSRLDQGAQTESLDREVPMSTRPLDIIVDESVRTESKLLLSMSATRTNKIMNVCPPNCPCNCHIQTVFKTPQLLQQITGFLLIGYSGCSILQQQCISSCLRQNPKSLQMTYFFPRWFVSQAISFSKFNAMRSTPTFNIKIRRAVPEASQLFSLSKFGDVKGIKTLFENKLASPDDVHFRGGGTALHYAVDHGCLELCRLLLNCGADPEWEDATGITPVEKAWRNILHLRAPPRLSESFSVLFPGSDFIQQRRFTRLHRLVIGLDTGSMKEELLECPQSVHTPDIDGWTPLHWATRRGNYKATCLLLENGADPHRATGDEKRNALHLAAQGNSLPCVQKLLQCRRGNLVLDINGLDGYGFTPLMVSASHNCAATTDALIQYGADLNISDSFGETAILTAVLENAHETITQLFNAGVDYTLKTNFGCTILHWAANDGDLQTLRLLTSARMRGVDVDARNEDGKTATELADARTEFDEAFNFSFEKLINSVLDEQDEIEEVGSLNSATTGGESWKSFDDVVWYEAECAAEMDVRDGEMCRGGNSGGTETRLEI